MNHTIYVKKEFTLITKNGKLTWVEKGKENMTMHDQILSEAQDYAKLGNPLPSFASFCWIPYYKGSDALGYALTDTKTSMIIAKLEYQNNFFYGSFIHPELKFLGEFVDSYKAKLYIEGFLYGTLLAEIDIIFVEDLPV